ncbi:uncharacterized protein IWZ02DRAFT_446296 [Phyllosticta citriasiana]|uniref:uncharacterized protein n=1 Tax=Phyllosticta citriasiana TaxID=595635 RepID=UPI0030FDA456
MRVFQLVLATICLTLSGARAIPLDKLVPTPPPVGQVAIPIEGSRPTKSLNGTTHLRPSHTRSGPTHKQKPTRLGATHSHKYPTPSKKHSAAATPARQTPKGAHTHTLEQIVKKVAEQVAKEKKKHPEIKGEPEERAFLELYGAIYMRKAMEKEGGAIRDIKKIEWHQAQLKKKMATMTHAELRNLVRVYDKLLAGNAKAEIQVAQQGEVQQRDSEQQGKGSSEHVKRAEPEPEKKRAVENKAQPEPAKQDVQKPAQPEPEKKEVEQTPRPVPEDKPQEKAALPKPQVKAVEPDAEPEYCQEEEKKEEQEELEKRAAPEQKHTDGLDFSIGITLTGAATIPTHRPHSRHSSDCHDRPKHQSTLLSVPTTLTVPLDIDDQGHVSVIGKPTGKGDHHNVPISKNHQHHHSRPTPTSRPTSKHHHKSKHHRPTGTSKHHGVHHGPTTTARHQHSDHARTKGHHPETTHPPHFSHGPASPSCTPVPNEGNLPRPAQNNPTAFVNFPLYATIANTNKIVAGFKATFIDRKSRIDASRHLLKEVRLERYDAYYCGSLCAKTKTCKGFNIFIQRDPGAILSAQCPNPPHQASAHCALFNVAVSRLPRSVAGKFLGKQRFQRVYTASNGYDQLTSYENWTGPGHVNGIYKPTSDRLLNQGKGQFLALSSFPGEIDPAVCINRCDKINAFDRGAAFQNHNFDVKNDTYASVKGYYRPCNFFNIFQTTGKGPAAGFHCSFWTSAPNAPKPEVVQSVNGQKVISSFWFNRRFDDIGKFHSEDLIENGPHNPDDARQNNKPRDRPENEGLNLNTEGNATRSAEDAD